MIALRSATVSTNPGRTRRNLRNVLSLIPLALAARRQRDHLSRLDAHLLDDIGLTTRMAEAEAARPVWDVPAHWKR